MLDGHWPEYTDAAQARHAAIFRDDLGHEASARGDYDTARRHWRYAATLREQANNLEEVQ